MDIRELWGYSVYQDYSCRLTRQEVEFTANSRDAFVRMQLLERNDRKKWCLWMGEGRAGKSGLKVKFFDFFNTCVSLGYTASYREETALYARHASRR